MPDTDTIPIILPATLAAELYQAVEQGEYANVEEAMHGAFEAWQAQRALQSWDVNELRRLVQEGIDSGPGIPAEEVFAELRARIALM